MFRRQPFGRLCCVWDWSTAASLATALGTLVLALATFVAVRAANRAARTAEYSMQIGIRPLLMPSRLTDTEQKIMWGDEHWARLSGSGAIAEVVDGNLYPGRCRSATPVWASR